MKKEAKPEIWILDDDPFITKALKLILEHDGYVVSDFSKFKTLKEALKKGFPNLILMDVLLNAEDGLQLARQLRSNKGYKNIPIILISANNVTPEEIELSKANAFIKKPFEITELRNIVLQILNTSQIAL